jgi:hypothetical protein
MEENKTQNIETTNSDKNYVDLTAKGKKESKKKIINVGERSQLGLKVERFIDESTHIVGKTLDFFIMIVDKIIKILKLNWGILLLGGFTGWLYMTDYNKLENFITFIKNTFNL